MSDYSEKFEKMRIAGKLAAQTLDMLTENIKEGVSTNYIDKLGYEYIRDNGGTPAFKGYQSFPNSLCISPNEKIVHGIPNNENFEEGDIVSIDCGVLMNNFYGDSAYTYSVGEINKEKKDLIEVTKQSLYLGIEKAVDGNRIGDIGYAIQNYVENLGYGVVRELVGHGVGKNLHEPPEVPNYGSEGEGLLLKEGMVIAIEPMINIGCENITQHNDGWTITTLDNKPSAHFEHTVVVRKNKAEILSSFVEIEKITNGKAS